MIIYPHALNRKFIKGSKNEKIPKEIKNLKEIY